MCLPRQRRLRRSWPDKKGLAVLSARSVGLSVSVYVSVFDPCLFLHEWEAVDVFAAPVAATKVVGGQEGSGCPLGQVRMSLAA
jgi:hypothetical protein